MGLAAGLVCGCGGLALIALVAAALLRLAVTVTNRLLGQAPATVPSSSGIAEWDWDDWDDEYTAPVRTAAAAPDPGLAKCAVIVVVSVLAFVLGFVLLGIAMENLVGLKMWRDESQLVVAVLDLPITDLVLTAALCVLLPTTFWRAALIAFVYNLIIFVLTLSAGAIVALLVLLTH
jgi:hypothetical protein